MSERAVRVAVVADLLEEGWPSMDLVAEMLVSHLRAPVRPILLRPEMQRRVGRLMRNGRGAMIDRVVNRYYDYPRWLRAKVPSADVFHVVDHSYAHLVTALPRGRVVVTCHDTDAFRSVLNDDRESKLPRALVRRVAAGLAVADVVTCVSETTRRDLVASGLVDPERAVVVPNGVHPACTPDPEAAGDRQAAALLGDGAGLELLHVGSTIARKRIDVLLEAFAGVAANRPGIRLVRVGGALTSSQEALAAALGIRDRVVVLPPLDRATLAAVYRRAALALLPSEREGFGLPVIEALACGTPVVASDLPVLREVGGGAVAYAPMGEVARWRTAILALLEERETAPGAWTARRRAGIEHAARFSWADGARQLAGIYTRLAERAEA